VTVIGTHEDEHDLQSDADGLDAIQAEVEREGASGGDVAAVADAVIAARKAGYGAGVDMSRPAVALLTTSPTTSPQVFLGYWQPNGSWRDHDGGPGGLELAQAIGDHLANDKGFPSTTVYLVTVDFQSFSGESPASKTWDREALDGGIDLPACEPRR
jgi:hypothetical protein